MNKELKQVFIPYTNIYEPITTEDRSSLENSIKRLKVLLNIVSILFFVSFSIICVLIYEYFTKNNIWLIDNEIKAVVFTACFLSGISGLVFIPELINKIKLNKKILESKKIGVVRGVVESKFFNRSAPCFSIAGGAPFDLKNAIDCSCSPGQYIELRSNPYTIRRVDDNLYDVNFIYECKYLNEIKEYEDKLLKLQKELKNTSSLKQEKMIELNDNIDNIKKRINYTNEKLSELPKRIEY